MGIQTADWAVVSSENVRNCFIIALLDINPFNASWSILLLFEGSAPYWSNPLILIFDF